MPHSDGADAMGLAALDGSEPVFEVEGARLEHLMCFIDIPRLEGEVQALEAVMHDQAKDVAHINSARGQEVAALTAQACVLRTDLHGDDSVEDLLLRPEPTCSRLPAASDRPAGAQVAELARRAELAVRAEDLCGAAARLSRLLTELRAEVRDAERAAEHLAVMLETARGADEQGLQQLRQSAEAFQDCGGIDALSDACALLRDAAEDHFPVRLLALVASAAASDRFAAADDLPLLAWLAGLTALLREAAAEGRGTAAPWGGAVGASAAAATACS